jgi:hypothetical protein
LGVTGLRVNVKSSTPLRMNIIASLYEPFGCALKLRGPFSPQSASQDRLAGTAWYTLHWSGTSQVGGNLQKLMQHGASYAQRIKNSCGATPPHNSGLNEAGWGGTWSLNTEGKGWRTGFNESGGSRSRPKEVSI